MWMFGPYNNALSTSLNIPGENPPFFDACVYTEVVYHCLSCFACAHEVVYIIYLFLFPTTGYSDGSTRTANDATVNSGGQCLQGVRMAILIGEWPTGMVSSDAPTQGPSDPANTGVCDCVDIIP